MKDHVEWIQAACRLAENPHLQIRCPACGMTFLSVEDEKIDRDHFDRNLRCSNCGAHEVIYKRYEM